MSTKFPICPECYYNNREPAICEDCSNGSEFEPEIDEEFSRRVIRIRSKPTKRKSDED